MRYKGWIAWYPVAHYNETAFACNPYHFLCHIKRFRGEHGAENADDKVEAPIRELAQIGGIALLEPILVPVWEFLAWHAEPTYQPPRWWTYVGGSLILAGLLWRYAGARQANREANPPPVDCSDTTRD